LILTRVSGFGQTGPYRTRPGFGTVAETGSGYAFLNGWPDTPPTSPPFGFADSIAGISAAFGTAMALYRRETHGVGEVIDVALYEPLMFILGDSILNFGATGEVMTRQGNTTGAASPRGIYEASDGRWLSIAASSQTIAVRFFQAIGRPDLLEDERFATNAARMRNDAAVQRIVRDWVRSHTRAEALEILDRYEVVAAPVNDSSDIVADPHFRERTLVELVGTVLGRVVMPGPVLHVASYAGPSYVGVPAIGEHTREVLSEVLHLSEAEQADLTARGAISLPEPLGIG
jgi:crotonobetainyl-CoA:carnitine CoA-transferase CaiB-like acyl-CoA transferase